MPDGVAATTLWIPIVQLQFHTTTHDGFLQVQMVLPESCGGLLVDKSVKLNPECAGDRRSKCSYGLRWIYLNAFQTRLQKPHKGWGTTGAVQKQFPREATKPRKKSNTCTVLLSAIKQTDQSLLHHACRNQKKSSW